MADPDKFREHADSCLKWAAMAGAGRQRDAFMRIAEGWRDLANDVEDRARRAKPVSELVTR